MDWRRIRSRSSDRRRRDGAIETAQRVVAPHPLVESTDEGARSLGRGYWLAVRSISRGLVRCRESDGGVALRLFGFRPALLTFGPPQVAAEPDGVSCTYEITGGLLARRAGGTLRLLQTAGRPVELCVSVAGFFPRLGVLYGPFQRRFHASVSRRYFSRLIGGEHS